MKTIWKYVLDSQIEIVEMPAGAKIVHVSNQNDDVCLWAEINTQELKTEKRLFRFFGTGHEMYHNENTTLDRIGTVSLCNGLVFHAYEEVEMHSTPVTSSLNPEKRNTPDKKVKPQKTSAEHNRASGITMDMTGSINIPKPSEYSATIDGAEIASNILYEGSVYKLGGGDSPKVDETVANPPKLTEEQIAKFIKSGILWVKPPKT